MRGESADSVRVRIDPSAEDPRPLEDLIPLAPFVGHAPQPLGGDEVQECMAGRHSRQDLIYLRSKLLLAPDGDQGRGVFEDMGILSRLVHWQSRHNLRTGLTGGQAIRVNGRRRATAAVVAGRICVIFHEAIAAVGGYHRTASEMYCRPAAMNDGEKTYRHWPRWV
jgi:hypothetical protein